MKKIFNSLSKLSLLSSAIIILMVVAAVLFSVGVYIKNLCAEYYLSEISKSAFLYIDPETFKQNFKLFFDNTNMRPDEEYRSEISNKLNKLCSLYSDKIEFALYTVDSASAMTDRVLASEKYNFDKANFVKLMESLLVNDDAFFRQGNLFNRQIYLFSTILDKTGTVVGLLALYTPDTKIGQISRVFTRLSFLVFILLLGIVFAGAIYIIKLKPADETISISNEIKKEVDVIENSLNQVMTEFEKKNNEFYMSVNKLILSEKRSVKIVMASGISHDLKNYLVPLQGYIILLQKLVNKLDDKDFKEKSDKYFSIITNQISKLDELSKSLSLVSRPSDIKYTPVDLNNLVIESVKLVHDVAAKYAGYDFFVDEHYGDSNISKRKLEVISCKNAPKVNGDAYSLSQLMAALLLNALNAFDDQEYRLITVGMKRLDDSGEFGIYVKDNGSGMDENIKEFAFEPYLITIDKKGFDTGMGFIKVVASRHDARIEFHSDSDNGTEIIIWFPPEEQIT